MEFVFFMNISQINNNMPRSNNNNENPYKIINKKSLEHRTNNAAGCIFKESSEIHQCENDTSLDCTADGCNDNCPDCSLSE